METVTTSNEAMMFFLSNSSGEVRCEKDGRSKVVNCYPHAEEFFKTGE